MDKQFTTLTSSYHDNYLQYKVTGNASYQNSYMSAEQGIQTILSSLQDQVNSQNQQISDFYNTDVEGKLRDLQGGIRSTQKNIVKDRDRAIGASMRMNTATTTPGVQIPQSYTISIGVLSAIAVLLLVLQ
jgi:peptidoglycan hydrolase CwlO-like protein